MPPTAAHPAHSSTPTRAFGRFVLRRLLGKSDASMAWLAVDSRSNAEMMLTMPRVPPASATAIASWLATARRAARLDHPNIAPVAACDVHDHWPYVTVERRSFLTLDEWLAQHARPMAEDAALWLGGVLRGLAFAHDAGIAHQDLQFHNLLLNDRGQVSVMALSVAGDATGAAPARAADTRSMPLDPMTLRDQRTLAERDVLACGVLLHRLLAGEPALGMADTARALERMAPAGRELVRLPWTTPQPIPEALRAIVNRSTSGQQRLRYRSARTFLGALNGWREDVSDSDGGPIALLLDRLHTVGHLPALPGLATRVQRVTNIESQRTDEIARHLLPDMALSFELLRTFNSAHVQGTQIAGNGAVLTLRRVVSLVGINGVRAAANGLRVWPGPLGEDAARAMQTEIDRVRLAGHTAQALRPAGYDAEVVYLIAALQNLGRLLLRYHFSDEAEQIELLMQPSPSSGSADPAGAEQPGFSEEAAAYAVLGVDVESFANAVIRHWGFGDDIAYMIRRLPVDAPPRKPDGDNDLLRVVASVANETVDAVHRLPAAKLGAALGNIVQRYGRILNLNSRALHDALQEAKETMRTGGTEAKTGEEAGLAAPQDLPASPMDRAAA